MGSLRWRLGLAYAIALAVMLSLVLIVAGSIVERALIDSTASRLEIEAGLIATETGGRRGITATDLAAGDLAAVLGGQETAVIVLDPGGTTLASEANGAAAAVTEARLDPATYAAILGSGTAADAVVPAGATTERVLVVAVPVQLRTEGGPPVDRGRPDDKGPPPGRGLGNQNPGQGSGSTTTTDTTPNAIAQLAVSLAAIDATMADLRARMLL